MYYCVDFLFLSLCVYTAALSPGTVCACLLHLLVLSTSTITSQTSCVWRQYTVHMLLCVIRDYQHACAWSYFSGRDSLDLPFVFPFLISTNYHTDVPFTWRQSTVCVLVLNSSVSVCVYTGSFSPRTVCPFLPHTRPCHYQLSQTVHNTKGTRAHAQRELI